jgi:hypothetical protein
MAAADVSRPSLRMAECLLSQQAGSAFRGATLSLEMGFLGVVSAELRAEILSARAPPSLDVAVGVTEGLIAE